MELICPDCLGLLATADGKTARCTTHGGEFQILFSHWEAAPSPSASSESSAIEFLPTHDACCYVHKNAPATHLCSNCGTQMCETCTFDGSRCCSNPTVNRANETPQLAMASATAEVQPVLGQQCAQHPNVRASYACRSCGTALCDVCAFTDPNGSRYCPDCMSRRASGLSSTVIEKPPPAGTRCAMHPNIAAVRQCKLCSAFMCATCDFALPDNVHICPKCAAAPQTKLSRKRKQMLIAAYVLAVWCTVLFGAMTTGFLAQFAHSREDLSMLGIFLFVFLLFPSIAGFTVSLTAKARGVPNPPAVWIAIVWNGLILGGFLLLDIIGILTK